jgi:hypothetical protein
MARTRLSLKRSPKNDERWRVQFNLLRAAVPGGEFESAWSEGQSWQVDDAIRGALAAHGEPVPA